MYKWFIVSSALELICGITLWLVILSEGSVVGQIGTVIDENVQYDFDDFGNRFLISQDLATANGTVSSFRYCYYLNDRGRNTYQATVAIYRLEQDIYTLVSDSFNITVNRSEQVNEEGFNCGELIIPEVEIVQGDIIGVCSRDFDSDDQSIGRLNLVAEVDYNTALLRSDERGEVRDIFCTSPGSVVMRFSRNDVELTEDSNKIILLYANITNNTDTTTDVTIEVASFANDNGPIINTLILKLVGIILSLLFLLLMCGICLLAVLLVLKRKKNGTKPAKVAIELNHSFTPLDNQDIIPFPNVSYQQAPTREVVSIEPLLYTVNSGSEYRIEPLDASDFYSSIYEADERNVQLEDYDMNSDEEEMCSPLIEYELATEVYQNITRSTSVDKPTSVFFNMLEENQSKDIYDGITPYSIPATQETSLYHQMKSIGIKKIGRNHLESIGHLGSGQFGSVEKVIWRQGHLRVCVALKSLNSQHINEADRVKFLQEAVVMAQFRHPNIISLYGVVSIGEPIALVIELATKGDLRRILYSMQPDPKELVTSGLRDTLLVYSQQIALGMQYLSSKYFVHRDLAARNILVSEHNICKIADFGMSCGLDDSDYYISSGGPVPVKWTAPEAIKFNKYSIASDVWSYGCVLYEIWSLGKKPFLKMNNFEVIKLVSNGKRLHSPPGCPRKIYKLMLLCWKAEAPERPIFRSIVNILLQDQIFYIPPNELMTHPQAGMLGAPLTAGVNMYKELYSRYSKQ